MRVATDIWVYREPAQIEGADLIGYRVEALDGHIGKIDETSNNVDASYIVVDTGPWIFGKKVMLPAGVISQVDHDDEVVTLNRTKEQIKSAPELHENAYDDEESRSVLGTYYGPGGIGWQDW
jgi:hypothetical protein